jgi:hypothetical protein
MKLAYTAALSAGVLATAAAHGQVTLGQVDDFQDGTVHGWRVGGVQHPAPPSNLATGGPGGAGDAFLRLTALGGAGPGSRLSAFNTAQWAGDYGAAGVGVITMDVQNFGPEELSLRLALLDPMGGAPTNFAITAAVVVPAGSGWMSAAFAIDAASLIVLQGTAGGALGNATELRLFHNPNADYPSPPMGPPSVNAVVGVDNIRAVPGVGAAWVVVGGGVLVGRRRR